MYFFGNTTYLVERAAALGALVIFLFLISPSDFSKSKGNKKIFLMKRQRVDDGSQPAAAVNFYGQLAYILPSCLKFVLVDEFKNADGMPIGHLVKSLVSLRNVKMAADQTATCWICEISTLLGDSAQVHIFVTPIVDTPSQWITTTPFVGNAKLLWRTLWAQNKNDLMNTFVAFLYACFRQSGDINVSPKTLFAIDESELEGESSDDEKKEE
jgi:hypothetical protein